MINELGLDVGRLGLAVMDAAQAVEAWPMPVTSPALLFHLAALGPEERGRLADRLRSLYPRDHAVTLVNVSLGDRGTSRATFALPQLEESLAHLAPGACLFLPPVRSS